VVHCADGNEGMRLLQQGSWDALILDLMLPGVDGLEICRRARAMARYTPIIITSARSSEVHRILGLELGADDYLAKPFSMLELVARVKALLRRVDAMARNLKMDAGSLILDGLAIDPITREVSLDGRRLDLTPREFDLLYFFARQPGKVFSRMDLLNAVWGYSTKATSTRSTPTSTACAPRSRPIRRNRCASSRCGGAATNSRPGGAAMRLTLTQRLSLVFAVLLLVCCGTSAWLQVRSNQMHELEVVQGLSRDLAQHIASDTVLMDTKGLMPGAVRDLFSQLMLVNPSVEVYLLDTEGKIVGSAAPEGRIRRERVDLAPIQRLLRGDALPIPGDDPRSVDGRKVFSAAPLKVDGKPAGYLYVVLLGEDHDRLAERGATSAALNTALLSIGLVALLCLIAGLTAFALITRPLRRLTETVSQFDIDGVPVTPPTAAPMEKAASHDEIAMLDATFRQMQARLGEQWRTLTRQDQERRELVANISHDLRTPLASLHGYLETLSLKDATLSPADRRRYLGIALDQSRKVGGLAQSLLELVRLEHGFVQPVLERFSLTDLAQDIFQKFELTAEARQVELKATFALTFRRPALIWG
jgi:DNA-binding response OmpR family regulator